MCPIQAVLFPHLHHHQALTHRETPGHECREAAEREGKTTGGTRSRARPPASSLKLADFSTGVTFQPVVPREARALR